MLGTNNFVKPDCKTRFHLLSVFTITHQFDALWSDHVEPRDGKCPTRSTLTNQIQVPPPLGTLIAPQKYKIRPPLREKTPSARLLKPWMTSKTSTRWTGILKSKSCQPLQLNRPSPHRSTLKMKRLLQRPQASIHHRRLLAIHMQQGLASIASLLSVYLRPLKFSQRSQTPRSMECWEKVLQRFLPLTKKLKFSPWPNIPWSAPDQRLRPQQQEPASSLCHHPPFLKKLPDGGKKYEFNFLMKQGNMTFHDLHYEDPVKEAPMWLYHEVDGIQHQRTRSSLYWMDFW